MQPPSKPYISMV